MTLTLEQISKYAIEVDESDEKGMNWNADLSCASDVLGRCGVNPDGSKWGSPMTDIIFKVWALLSDPSQRRIPTRDLSELTSAVSNGDDTVSIRRRLAENSYCPIPFSRNSCSQMEKFIIIAQVLGLDRHARSQLNAIREKIEKPCRLEDVQEMMRKIEDLLSAVLGDFPKNQDLRQAVGQMQSIQTLIKSLEDHPDIEFELSQILNFAETIPDDDNDADENTRIYLEYYAALATFVVYAYLLDYIDDQRGARVTADIAGDTRFLVEGTLSANNTECVFPDSAHDDHSDKCPDGMFRYPYSTVDGRMQAFGRATPADDGQTDPLDPIYFFEKDNNGASCNISLDPQTCPVGIIDETMNGAGKSTRLEQVWRMACAALAGNRVALTPNDTFEIGGLKDVTWNTIALEDIRRKQRSTSISDRVEKGGGTFVDQSRAVAQCLFYTETDPETSERVQKPRKRTLVLLDEPGIETTQQRMIAFQMMVLEYIATHPELENMCIAVGHEPVVLEILRSDKGPDHWLPNLHNRTGTLRQNIVDDISSDIRYTRMGCGSQYAETIESNDITVFHQQLRDSGWPEEQAGRATHFYRLLMTGSAEE